MLMDSKFDDMFFVKFFRGKKSLKKFFSAKFRFVDNFKSTLTEDSIAF